MNTENRGIRLCRILAIIACVGVGLKFIFVDLGCDSEYELVMGYRIATGDRLFFDMWEPHQTSALFVALLIKVFIGLFKTTTGVVVFVHTCCFFIRAAISVFSYNTLKKYSSEFAFLSACLFFIITPKDSLVPDFANIAVSCSFLMALFLIRYLRGDGKIYLYASGLMVCFSAVAYPSTVLTVCVIVFVLIKRKDYKALVGVLSECAALGIGFVAFILWSAGGMENFLNTIDCILALEPSHTRAFGEKIAAYTLDAVLMVAVCFAVYLLFRLCSGLFKAKTKEFRRNFSVDFAVLSVLAFSFVSIVRVYSRNNYALVFVGIMMAGFYYCNRLNQEEQFVSRLGMVSSLACFASTLLMTDLGVAGSVTFLFTGAAFALLPLLRHLEEKSVSLRKWVPFVLLAVFLLRGVYIIRPMYLQLDPIYKIRQIVKDGPAKGIVSEYMGPYMQNVSFDEWGNYVKDGQSIYIVGCTEKGLDTLGYLYMDTVIGAPSVMSTPNYNETLKKYWEIHPDKYPDVVIASCWYGSLESTLASNEWFMNWIENEYCPSEVIDGNYWRYYIR